MTGSDNPYPPSTPPTYRYLRWYLYLNGSLPSPSLSLSLSLSPSHSLKLVIQHIRLSNSTCLTFHSIRKSRKSMGVFRVGRTLTELVTMTLWLFSNTHSVPYQEIEFWVCLAKFDSCFEYYHTLVKPRVVISLLSDNIKYQQALRCYRAKYNDLKA